MLEIEIPAWVLALFFILLALLFLYLGLRKGRCLWWNPRKKAYKYAMQEHRLVAKEGRMVAYAIVTLFIAMLWGYAYFTGFRLLVDEWCESVIRVPAFMLVVFAGLLCAAAAGVLWKLHRRAHKLEKRNFKRSRG